MADSPDLLYVLLPTAPGDLIASRSVLTALAKNKSLHLVVKKSVAPLLAGLGLASSTYEIKESINVHHPEFKSTLQGLGIPAEACVLDLIGSLPALDWLTDRNGPSTGYNFDKTIRLPYDNLVEWSLSRDGAEDRSHYAVRLLRIIPDYAGNIQWPDAFDLPSFGYHLAASPVRIAMIPGSSKGGAVKRMPISFWRLLAASLREQKLTPVWFLGPDEADLVDHLVYSDDICTAGAAWPEIIRMHATCAYGFSNDTCHVHIRAHIPRSTFVFFRRDDGPEWGSYPLNVNYIEAPATLNDRQAYNEACSWLCNQIDKGRRA